MTLPSHGNPVPAQLQALGPYFALDLHDPDEPPQPPWRPMGELVTDASVLADRIEAVRAFLAAGGGQAADAVETRVAASVVHLGLAARILSPALALAVLDGCAGPLTLAGLRWQPQLGSAFPLSRARDTVTRSLGTEADVADALGSGLFDGAIAELATATAAFGVSEHILRGNAASGLNGAATVLAAARPEHAPRVRAVLARVLRHPALAGAGAVVDGSFRRRSCCLIYRAAPGRAGALCGDCVLTGRPGRR
ncbi:(2Fe-2S)-binding protein [Saccharothrix sp. ST-888]|uniref:(2Fe-2S)-binding protein n=1 Tax=Saccharothrix sp. ST-888 TaxID=1427391 RepID=UPI0005EC0437|nr:(2Fe-2S)-binding protein [Saccharothrix sp. ST-888]